MGTDTDNARLGRYVGRSYGSLFGLLLFFSVKYEARSTIVGILVFFKSINDPP